MEGSDRCRVFVGSKSITRYLLALLYKFYVEGCTRVEVAARGRFVHRAVAATTGFLALVGRGFAVVGVEIGSVALRGPSDERRVSKISIAVTRMDETP